MTILLLKNKQYQNPHNFLIYFNISFVTFYVIDMLLNQKQNENFQKQTKIYY